MWWRDPQKEVWVGMLYEHDIVSLEVQVHHKHVKIRRNLKLYLYVGVVVTFTTLTGGTETLLTKRLDKTSLNTLRRILKAHSLKRVTETLQIV